ncbi:ANTH-domain-containing protein [Mycena vitilis]|nr:ANTH-domain-containing protein [Mycena vitilis]
MSSYEKVVKLACKPKAAPPKAKYLDPIIAATWDDGGAVHDVCKALSPRFREPNAIVVFKALIVLHTMIRNGSTDNVLGYLSGSQVLRLSNVSTGQWDGYQAPENLQNYAAYLDSRIHAYRDLKHDAVRVQSDSNRDARTTAAVNGGPLQRSKTLAGRKLRSMTVEKGLLRETRAVHGMLDALVACRFYLDDLEDPLTLTALRMLVKDLLILFQAGNEGVINLLEHYFEMSHTDAAEALTIYRHFCAQTELVVEYLGVARKLQNLLNVPVPNLKHAPVSLAGALQEYLDDPAFEQNRIEYRTNKEAVKRGGKAKSATPPVPALPSAATASSSQPSSSTSTNGAVNGTNGNAKATPPDVMVDFFAAIEETQPTMFNPATNSPNTAYFQQTAANPNPFQRLQMQPTGAFGPQPTGAFTQSGAFGPQPNTAFPNQNGPQFQLSGLQPQATGFNPFARPVSAFGMGGVQAQATGMGAFGGQPGQIGAGAFGAQATGAGAFGQQQPSFLRPQMTGGAANPFRASQYVPSMPAQGSFSAGPVMGADGGAFGGAGGSGFGPGVGLRPQMTGGAGAANPFRASTMFSQGTGPAALSGGFASGSGSAPSVPPFVLHSNSSNTNDFNLSTSGAGASIARPASAPLSALVPASSPTGLQLVKTHQTGTRNPFGAPPPREETVPALPRQPTLMELAMGSQQQQTQQAQQAQQQASNPQATGFARSTTKAFDYGASALGPGATDISGVASEFAFTKNSGIADGSASNGTGNGSNTTAMSDAGSSLFGSSYTGSGSTAATSSPALSFTPSSGGFGGGGSSGSFSPTVSAFSPSAAGFNPANSVLNSTPSGSPSPLGGFNAGNSALNTNSSMTGGGAFGSTPQTTGGVKAFKPSSSFGASLLEALPPIPGSAPGTPVVGVQQTGFFGGGSARTSLL